ncbi:MAG TPA: hypothetical protein VJU81_00725 [Methylomirabilota bacterium]|nr:hypothetical protein [Methylomirabilota bacterium]
MRKVLLSLVCAVVLLGTATVSDANITLSISDGTTTVSASKGGLVLTKSSPAPSGTLDVTDTMNILTCPTRPCRVYFPSGIVHPALPLSTDTFIIQDVASATPAKITKFDSGASADRVSMSGIKFTARAAGKILTVIYGNGSGDLRALTSTQSASYSVSAAFSGFFRTSAGLRAGACKAGTLSTDMDEVSEACVRLSITLNATEVNGQGTAPSTTVAVPCNNAFPTVNPCGTGGLWTATTGSFTGVNDGRSISCPSSCSPVHRSTLTARFNAINDVLQLTASTHGTMSNIPDQSGGAEESALALAGEVPLNRWVTTAPSVERCRAEWKSPAIRETRNIGPNPSTIPLSTELHCGFLAQAPPEGIPLISLADTGLLPGAASTRYEASRVTFLPEPGPGQLQFKGINTLSVSYDVFVGQDTSPTDRRLEDFQYVDCFNGSVHLAIQLVDSKGVGLGELFVYLGTENNFKNKCDGFESIGADIKNNPDARVDASQLLGGLAVPCCSKFSDLQKGQIGNARVRKIAFVVSRPISPPSDPLTENYKVLFKDANVNGITAVSSLRVVTGETRVTGELSTNGVSFVITKLTGTFGLGIKKVIPSSEITIIGGKFAGSVNTNDIDPESGAQYGISLCPNGTEQNDPSLPPNTPLGICIADQAIMTLL